MTRMQVPADQVAFGAKILMVDDDPGIRDVVSDFLGKHGYMVETAADAREMERVLARGGVDLIVLDVMLPGEDGLAICRRLATGEGGPSIIMLSAMGEDTDRIVGLELGADDYLAKPFSPRELLARLRAVLRRTELGQGERLSVGEVSVDLGSRRASIGEREVELTGLEFDLLVALMRRAGRVVPRATLFELAGRSDVTVNDRAVDVHISHLRRKLGDDPPRFIKTVRGVGYMYVRP